MLQFADSLETRIVIADEQPLMLEGLAQVLREFPTTAVNRCTSGTELFAAMLEQPDLAITDIRLSDRDGLSVLREVRERGVNVPVILVTGPLRDTEVLEGMELGIRGLVAKESPIAAVSHCVRTVLEGGTCLDQTLVGRAMTTMMAREAARRELAQQLTAREMEVLLAIAAGTKAREAAARLGISVGTLKVHLHHIYRKLGVSSRDGLVALAREKGLVNG
jgi:DNA-binding NarL/FixJ family response regulator